jgi:hypothetical protein
MPSRYRETLPKIEGFQHREHRSKKGRQTNNKGKYFAIRKKKLLDEYEEQN